jgi:Ran GTPase-activating protein (RanGAP) involved in mRNA processing and transport
MAIFGALGRGNKVLAELGLSNNACGNAAAQAAGEMLKTNIALRHMDFSWNQVRPEGVKGLCIGLEDNTTLKTLNLSWNGLEDAGVVSDISATTNDITT